MTISADASVASAQGIDVSNFQGRFNWAGTTGLSFGIYRLTQGLPQNAANSPDPDAAWNHQQIQAKGLIRGAYHFLDPNENGQSQAAYFVQQASKLGPIAATDMFWLDNETGGASPASVAACAQGFMKELDTLLPHQPRGVYTFIDFALNGNCAGLGHYPLWIANPNTVAPTPPLPWAAWTFWQWGIRSTDMDAFNGTSAQLAQWLKSFQQTDIPKPGQPWSADGTTSFSKFAHDNHTFTVASLIATVTARGGNLGPGELAFFNGLIWGHISPDDPVPPGTVLWP